MPYLAQIESAIGAELYSRLEQWFVERECKQVESDTWVTNKLSRGVHAAMGFVEYGVTFRKRF